MRYLHVFLRPVLPLAMLALSACADDAEQPDDAPAAQEAALPVEPDAGIGDGAPPPPALVETIPERFLGVWDRAASGCDPHSETRTDIGPGSIGFYESQGEVTRVAVDGPDRIAVSLAMEGEGERWDLVRSFTLSEGGETLTASAVGEGQFEPVPLERCDS